MTQSPPPPPTPPPTPTRPSGAYPEKQPTCAQQSLLRGVRVGGGVRRRLVQRRAVRPRTRLQPAQQALVNESLLYLLMEGFVSRLASVDHFNSALLRLLELLMTSPRDPRTR